MQSLLTIGFMALIGAGLYGCSKSEHPHPVTTDTAERYFGTYVIKRSNDLMDPSTGNHFFVNDSFLLIVDKSTSSSAVCLFSQDTCMAFLTENKFIVNSHIVRRSFGEIKSQIYEVTGSGLFRGDSLYYTEKISGGEFGLRGKSQYVGVKK